MFFFQLSSQDWNLVWEDNFDGNLDNSKWTHDIGTGTNTVYTVGVTESQYYQYKIPLNNGIATITVSEEAQMV